MPFIQQTVYQSNLNALRGNKANLFQIYQVIKRSKHLDEEPHFLLMYPPYSLSVSQIETKPNLTRLLNG